MAALLALFLAVAPAQAGPYLVFDAENGDVLAEDGAFDPWYPASLTKLMTTYVVLRELRSGELLPNSPVVVSERALREPPSRMGFPVGTVMTIDTALKIIMVKSANDIAYAIAESVAGSGDAFVALMNAESRRLGLTATHWANPHGLPDPRNVSTARDIAVLTLALIHEFPEYADLFRITALTLDGNLISTHNRLLEQFPGADGMKTGYICSSGFNVVASATRHGRRIVAVVLGDETELARSVRAARLLTEGFATRGGMFSGRSDLAELRPTRTPALQPADLRPTICRDRSAEEIAAARAEEEVLMASSYLIEPFQTMQPVPISLGGALAIVTPAVTETAIVGPVPLPRPRPSLTNPQAGLVAAGVVAAYTAVETTGSSELFAPLPRPNPLR